MEKKNNWKAWLYLAPALVLLAVFTFYPFFKTIGISFLENYDPLAAASGASFKIGIGNFRDVISYSKFKEIMFNTILIVVITVPASTLLALLIAVALNSIKPLQKIFQTIFFLPYVTNSIAIGMVFSIMFQVVGVGDIIQTAGIINKFLGFFGIGAINWIGIGASKAAKMTVLCIYIIWNALPFKILILVGALQSVNKQYYDAAKIDCASRFRVFTKITVPLISPMIAYVLITGFIGAFKEYTSVIGIFGEKLDIYGMNTVVGFIYNALANTNYGRASAGALILFVIILIITALNLYVSKKKVHY